MCFKQRIKKILYLIRKTVYLYSKVSKMKTNKSSRDRQAGNIFFRFELSGGAVFSGFAAVQADLILGENVSVP
jgi:hypothetical protein